MDVNQCTGALAIDVEVADVEVSSGSFDPLAIACKYRTRQAIDSVVRNTQCILEIPRLDDRKYGTEDLFLSHAGCGSNVGNHCRRHEETFIGQVMTLPAGKDSSFILSDLERTFSQTGLSQDVTNFVSYAVQQKWLEIRA